jgi:hypothetical protein
VVREYVGSMGLLVGEMGIKEAGKVFRVIIYGRE